MAIWEKTLVQTQDTLKGLYFLVGLGELLEELVEVAGLPC